MWSKSSAKSKVVIFKEGCVLVMSLVFGYIAAAVSVVCFGEIQMLLC